MEIVKLKCSALEPNTGQVNGLPMNPRQWTATDVNTIAASLEETPELFEARPLLVYPQEGKYVILGGNLRFEGAKHNKMEEVPCIIFPEDTPIEKLKEIVIKDNGAFGSWDYDALANEWDDLPLTEWGVPAWDSEEVDEEMTDEETPTERPDDFEYEAKYGVIINCKDEIQQKELYESLTQSGFDCKVVTV